jgi:hypothetical protein
MGMERDGLAGRGALPATGTAIADGLYRGFRIVMRAAIALHFRRVVGSGNTHLAAGWGPWNEVHLRDAVPGYLSTHPDVANNGVVLGITWVEADGECQVPPVTGGRLWLAIVTHK